MSDKLVPVTLGCFSGDFPETYLSTDFPAPYFFSGSSVVRQYVYLIFCVTIDLQLGRPEHLVLIKTTSGSTTCPLDQTPSWSSVVFRVFEDVCSIGDDLVVVTCRIPSETAV